MRWHQTSCFNCPTLRAELFEIFSQNGSAIIVPSSYTAILPFTFYKNVVLMVQQEIIIIL